MLLHSLWNNAIRMKAVLKKFSKFHRFGNFKHLITYKHGSKAITLEY